MNDHFNHDNKKNHDHKKWMNDKKLSSDDDLRLQTILDKICADIEIPIFKLNQPDQMNEQRLIEMVEEKNYPFEPLICPHREEKDIGEDCVECILQQYETYKERYLSLADQLGFQHTHTLKAAFDYYNSLITQYRLTEGDALLDKIFSFCMDRGNWSTYYILAIQARAFLRFKQGKYPEALNYFQQQIDLLGPHEAIYENMALVHARLRDNQSASICYARAILILRQKDSEKERYATLLMGLATVVDEVDSALLILEESLRLLRKKFDKPHSLMAKNLGAMGDLYAKQNNFSAAEKCFEEAVRIFVDTCGYDTPLTSNAMNRYANCLLQLGNLKKAIDMYIESLAVWVKVDSQSFEPNVIAEALNVLLRESNNNKIEAEQIKKSLDVLESLQHKIEKDTVLSHDLNTLCILKMITDIFIVNKAFAKAKNCCQSFLDCLHKLDEAELGEMDAFRKQFMQESQFLLDLLKGFK